MAEPEGLLIEGARLATSAARDLWRRVSPPTERRVLPLARIKERLEVFLHAVYGEMPSLHPNDPPPAPTWLARLMGRAPRHLALRTAAASTDGEWIWLPRALDVSVAEDTALSMYRLLAVEQAARVVRGTPGFLPQARTEALERDLYLVAEAVAVDRDIAVQLPGLISDLRSARAAALVERPPLECLFPAERAVEMLLRAILSADPSAPQPGVPLMPTPADSRTWACEQAARLSVVDNRYRGTAIVPLWGQITRGASATTPDHRGEEDRDAALRSRRFRSAQLRQRPRVRKAADDEDDETPGTWMVRLDEPMESVEDPMGLQRPVDRDTSADPRDLADSLSELPEARMVRTPGPPREILESEGGLARRASASGGDGPTGVGIIYPEWDHRVGSYRERGAIVWPTTAPLGDWEWVDRVMARHRALVRQVRHRFDGLRPRRVRLGRQADGPDLDLSTYVTAFADWRAGRSGEDRLYTAERPGRRDLAIALLIDVSASTDSWVSGSLRIIDIEKEAVIVLLEALDALGDRHTILAFSGQGPEEVRLFTLKDFREPVSSEVRRRIAALEPDRYTRAGAAIRHASALLGRQGGRYRLLVMLSDGKPNDVDQYEGRYGIEDMRQAVAECRLQGLVPFCLTVDREAPAYLPSVFGRGGYALLRRPELLPGLLVEVVRKLLAG
jgi:nitric oxide reductase NorD protein